MESSNTNLLVLDDCLIGLEFEVECFNKPNIELWSKDIDHSLIEGCEYILKKPLNGDELLKAIDNLYTTLNIDTTNYRTSIHIHLDVRDLNIFQIMELIRLYVALEDVFYIDDYRKESPYCIKLGSYNFLNNFSIVTESSFLYHCSNSFKYLGLNLNSIIKYGSLELRTLPLITDKDEFIKYLNYFMSLKKYVLNDDSPLVGNLIKNTTSDNILQLVLGEKININISGCLKNAMRIAKDFESTNYLSKFLKRVRNK
jgi:hypothetical protein